MKTRTKMRTFNCCMKLAVVVLATWTGLASAVGPKDPLPRSNDICPRNKCEKDNDCDNSCDHCDVSEGHCVPYAAKGLTPK